MNLRHAAALALVGWYLMMPPGNLNTCPDSNTPISEWEVSASFDTATQCTSAKNKQWNDAFHAQAKVGFKGQCGGGFDPLWSKLMQAECIATDDPRLKGR